jgi:chromate transporter
MTPSSAASVSPVSFGAALRFWLKLGFISFGGPAGQIAIMHSELVERRRWISESRFLHALNYCMVLPGPEAQQLATYLGWLMHRTWGGILAGSLFVLPSLVLLIGLAWLYMAQGQQPLVVGLFDGLKPAVAALVIQAAHRLALRTLRHRLLWAVAALAFCAIPLGLPFPAVLALAAAFGWWSSRRWPRAFAGGAAHRGARTASGPHAAAWIDDETPIPSHAAFSMAGLVRALLVGLALWVVLIAMLAAALGWLSLLPQMAWFFTKAAMLTFGGAYAVLPYVYQGAVVDHGWLTAAQMLDGLALGETTPGPLIMVVAFVGFVGGWGPALGAGDWALGVAGASVATLFTFLPSFVFILAGGPFIEATRGRIGLAAPLTAISAAVVGVIAQFALFLVWHVLWRQGWAGGVDWRSAALLAVALAALLRWKLGVVPVLAACGGMGMLAALV